jgi:uncharacterized OsmC-like protein
MSEFTIQIEQVKDFEFRVLFDDASLPQLKVDEPPPLGRGAGPNPARLLATAIGSCLTASLLFCARKAHIPLDHMRTAVRTELHRNEQGRLRIGGVHVEIDPGVTDQDQQKALRCLELFEDYCVVTESVRKGIPVEVTVHGLEPVNAAG